LCQVWDYSEHHRQMLCVSFGPSGEYTEGELLTHLSCIFLCLDVWHALVSHRGGGGRSREMSFLQACFHSSSLPVFTFRAEFPLRRLFRHPLNLYMFPLQLLNKAEFSLCLSAAHCLYSYLPQSPRWLTMACSFTGVVVVVFKGPRSH
jgi:hypothetical protein